LKLTTARLWNGRSPHLGPIVQGKKLGAQGFLPGVQGF
jgi:hypothetical protein